MSDSVSIHERIGFKVEVESDLVLMSLRTVGAPRVGVRRRKLTRFKNEGLFRILNDLETLL